MHVCNSHTMAECFPEKLSWCLNEQVCQRCNVKCLGTIHVCLPVFIVEPEL